MDMQWMKRIDRFAGVPLCGLLRAFDLARGGGESPLPEDSGRAGGRPKIGVIKFWGMGSLILAAPLFQALRRVRPQAEMVLITLKQNQGIAELLKLADHVHVLELPAGAAGVAASIARFFAGLKALGLDAVIDVEYLSRFSAMAAYMTGAPVRVGYHSWDVWRGNLQTRRVAFNPYWHATENFFNLHRALGADAGEVPPVSIELKPEEEDRAHALLEEAGVEPGRRLIAVNTNASTIALARRWPESSFVDLVDRMVDADLGKVMLLGAPEEAPYVQGVMERLAHPKEVINLAGRSTLTDLVGVLRRADLLVTNDSGPLHLAAALGARTVSFFGPETPQLFGPRGEGHVVLYRGIDCSPCINIYNAKTVRCMRPEPECLTGITVDDAMAAVRKALGEQG